MLCVVMQPKKEAVYMYFLNLLIFFVFLLAHYSKCGVCKVLMSSMPGNKHQSFAF